jgi:multidrug efflux pump subunit AcrA (membrane-fusion protein)
MPHYINANGQIISPELNGAANHLLRSTEVSEIIAHKPGFLIRWGISIFFLVLLMIMGTTFFIHFPDVVPAKAKLTALNAPKEVKAKTGGRLVALKIAEQQHVHKNQVLGFIESNADHNEVIMLSGITDTLKGFLLNDKTEQLPAYLTAPLQHLGEIQQSYQAFMQAFILFKQYLSTGYYLKKKAMLQKDMAYLSRQYANLLQQRNLQEQDVELAKTTFTANESLKNDSVISAFDYRNEKSKYINKALSIPQINSTLLNNESSRHEKQKEIAQLENEIAQQKTVFLQALNTFKAQLDEWKQKYLLIAPIDGTVAFAGFMQENQQLETNRTICFINPENTNYYAEAYIPQNNFGKVKQGQKVLLKLPAYPYQEFGSLEGRLEFISNIATDSGYIAKVTFSHGLKTNYNKPVQYKDGLLAQGEIITEDLKLSDRLINSVKQVFKR